MPNLNELKSYKSLQSHYDDINNSHIREYFIKDSQRFDKFSIEFEDILFDYSKNRITDKTISLLCALAEEVNLRDRIEKMFSGEKINLTEKRAALHTALRNTTDNEIFVDGKNVIPDINEAKDKMFNFAEKLHSGEIRGFSDMPFTDIVNIGIGGSDLGPAMVCEALQPYSIPNLNVHFVSNVDSTDISETLKQLNPEQTLFIISSKSFTTQETVTNALTARDWFLSHTGYDQFHIAKHFVAVSTNEKAAQEFGIDKENMFGFWDWVGGRYSLWSSIGLSIVLYLGTENFKALLMGANKADIHFRNEPFEKNIPVLMGLLGIWYRNFFRASSHAVIPYDDYLKRLPEYLQQLDMESNGKSTGLNGKKVDYNTGPVIWGTAGTNAQHSFFQLIHQGTELVPVDFIAFIKNHNETGKHHKILMSNFFAQTEALMKGKNAGEAENELIQSGLDKNEIRSLLPHKIFPGNKPTNSILIKKLTPETLGMLLAFYEHRVFVQSTIWNINPFDQWGVELGKQLAKKILPELDSKRKVKSHDSSTNGLINYFRQKRK